MTCFKVSGLRGLAEKFVAGSLFLAIVTGPVLSSPPRLSAAELSVPRQGVVENVPPQSPYNGCLLVREGPGTTTPVKGNVANGTTVQIEATEGAWYKISAPLAGYVYSTYVKITDTTTIDTTNLTHALTLEEIVENSKPWTRDANLEERKKILADNDSTTPPELPANP
ncbi:MAG: SH3 domain-containing protein [Candidatus Riflebacteria bacterium]|jgi:hypothetical protein|nr:SH3 domain-containing protein [Candidatus Riflebacteria bacterium]